MCVAFMFSLYRLLSALRSISNCVGVDGNIVRMEKVFLKSVLKLRYTVIGINLVVQNSTYICFKL